MNRRLFRAAASVAAIAILAVVGYFVIGGFITANQLAATLKVGAPTVQGGGWPAPESPADIGYIGDPQAAFGMAFTDIALATDAGPMPAWLVPSSKGANASRWAIFIHGIGGRRENGYRFLPVLHDAGLPVIMLAYRNDADAPEDPNGYYAFGLTEWRDLDAAVTYALRNGASDIVLVAESMGGGIVGQFLRGSTRAASVSALVLDAPALNFRDAAGSAMETMRLPAASTLAGIGMWISGFSMPFRLADADVRAEIAAYPGPLFLSHGRTDSIVPVAGSDAVAADRLAMTTYLRTEAEHILSWREDPQRYDALLASFLASVPQR